MSHRFRLPHGVGDSLSERFGGDRDISIEVLNAFGDVRLPQYTIPSTHVGGKHIRHRFSTKRTAGMRGNTRKRDHPGVRVLPPFFFARQRGARVDYWRGKTATPHAMLLQDRRRGVPALGDSYRPQRDAVRAISVSAVLVQPS
jgi:hypothetical protein